MRRSSLAWGVVLLLLGLLLFADAAGIRLPGGARPMEFFWPLVLILAGAWVIFGVLMRPQLQSEQAFVELQGAVEAVVEINHGAGELHIAGGAHLRHVALGVARGQHDHRNLSQVGIAAHGVHELEAGHHRHLVVADHECGAHCLSLPECDLAVLGGHDLETLAR